MTLCVMTLKTLEIFKVKVEVISFHLMRLTLVPLQVIPMPVIVRIVRSLFNYFVHMSRKSRNRF